jgi:hypothetical protein
MKLIPGFRCDFRDPWGNRIQVVDLHDELLVSTMQADASGTHRAPVKLPDIGDSQREAARFVLPWLARWVPKQYENKNHPSPFGAFRRSDYSSSTTRVRA